MHAVINESPPSNLNFRQTTLLPEWVKRLLPGQWAQLGDVWVGRVTVTPAAARELLDDHNGANRPLSARAAGRFAEDIRNGHWQFTGEPCIIDSEGNIQSFQHRAEAICRAGKPIETLAVYGVDPEVFKVIDSGRAKKLSDRLAVANEISCTSLASTVAILGGFFATGKICRKTADRPSIDDVLGWLRRWPSIRDSVNFAVASRSFCPLFSGPGPLAALHWICLKANPERATRMFDGMVNHTLPAEPAWEAARTLAKTLGARRLTDEAQAGRVRRVVGRSPEGNLVHLGGITIRAFNAVARGEPLKTLRFSPETETFPRVQGWKYEVNDDGVFLPVPPPSETES